MPQITIAAGKTVEWNPEVLESLVAMAEAFGRAAPRGEEIAGLLFGEKVANGWHVTAWRSIYRENPLRPALPLTGNEEAVVRGMLRVYVSDSELLHTEPVGWFRSRLQGPAILSAEDTQVCEKFLSNDGCLAVILQPYPESGPEAAFFHVVPGQTERSSRRGVEVQISADEKSVPSSPQADPLEAVRSRPTTPAGAPFNSRRDRPRSRRRWMAPVASFAIGGLLASGLACYFWLDRPLRLDAQAEGSDLLVTWNGSAGFLTGATGAELDIADDERELTLDDLRRGQIVVKGAPRDLKIALRLRGPRAGEQRSVVTLIQAPTR